jgi:predicted NodU family carbamoyl transferase/glycosyltransferase involved in cell wall biosynthesis
MNEFTLPEIPDRSILGINYSGMHDSAIAIVAPDGAPVFAVSLERLSRVKQDGRPPFALLEHMPWQRIRAIAVSAPEEFETPADPRSVLHPWPFAQPRGDALRHGAGFRDFLDGLPVAKHFVGHQESHASSAFWASGFAESLCLTYDGGMSNDAWFGALFRCSASDGLQPLDRFSAAHYAKVTSLYTFVTALLGFSPNKHEGKITGLAAYGTPSERCRAFFDKWVGDEYAAMESTLRWTYAYDHAVAPRFIGDPVALEPFREATEHIPREEMAASIQAFAEDHVLEILARARARGWTSDAICLAGGLFANVRINQRVAQSGFSSLFVAPPMTDDGTALGAAWHVLSREPGFRPRALHSMYWGPSYPASVNEAVLRERAITFRRPPDAAAQIAALLAQGDVVALFQGGCEYGPRALGNRSILAPATDPDINRALNERLDRTEFMPFAPISRAQDAELLYGDVARVRHCAEFMTVTVDCTEELRRTCPAVVHVDGTARPQLVRPEVNPLMHEILTRYHQATGRRAIVNTSFNIHEEPIVCSPQDALRGFFESGLDHLYLEGAGLVSLAGNEAAEIAFLRERARGPGPRQNASAELNALLHRERAEALRELERKEAVIESLRTSDLLRELERKEAVIESLRGSGDLLRERTAQLEASRAGAAALQGELLDKQRVIHELDRAVSAYRATFAVLGWLIRPLHWLILTARGAVRRVLKVALPRLGVLNQHPPIPLSLPPHYSRELPLAPVPRISVVTPSFRQAAFIERTLRSVLDQGYPELEYVVQDGASQDGTREILERYAGRLASWESVPDGGQTEAINRGFARTSGEIMAWLNSDDILLPGALHYVADYFNQHPEVDVVYGNRILIDENDQQIGRWVLPPHSDEVLSWADFVPQETLFFRRRIWEKAGGRVDESFRFAMDWDLLVRFRDAGARFCRLPRFLGGFRIHPQQKTSAVISEVGFQEMNRIRARVLGRVPTGLEIRKAVMPYLVRHVATDIRWALNHKLRLGT